MIFNITGNSTINDLHLLEDGTAIIKGAQGASGVSTYSTFLAGAILVMVALVIVLNLVRSRTGRAIIAVRDNKIAAESVGISVTHYRMIAFVVSAALAGAAGALFGGNFSQLSATKFDSQHVDPHPGVRGPGRSGQYARLCHRGGVAHGAPRAAPSVLRLPHAHLRYRADLVMIFTNNPQLKAFFGRIKDRFASKKEVAADAQ